MCNFFSNLGAGDILQFFSTVAIGYYTLKVMEKSNLAVNQANKEAHYRFLLEVIRDQVKQCNTIWRTSENPNYTTTFSPILYEEWSPIVTAIHQSLDLIDHLSKYTFQKETYYIFWQTIDVQLKDLFKNKYNADLINNKDDVKILDAQVQRIKSTIP